MWFEPISVFAILVYLCAETCKIIMVKPIEKLIKSTDHLELFRVVEDGVWDVLKANFE